MTLITLTTLQSLPEDGRAYVGFLSSQLATRFVFPIPSRVSLPYYYYYK